MITLPGGIFVLIKFFVRDDEYLTKIGSLIYFV